MVIDIHELGLYAGGGGGGVGWVGVGGVGWVGGVSFFPSFHYLLRETDWVGKMQLNELSNLQQP